MCGSRGQVVKAPGCGSGIRGFKSHRLPHFMEITSLFLISISILIGFFIGFYWANFNNKSKPRKINLGNTSDKSLENELLKDQVKQLEAKIKTLEKALDMTK